MPTVTLLRPHADYQRTVGSQIYKFFADRPVKCPDHVADDLEPLRSPNGRPMFRIERPDPKVNRALEEVLAVQLEF